MKPILITGGCGFIGSNIAAALASQGRDVLCFDNMSRDGVQKNARWLSRRWGNLVRIVEADVRDGSQVYNAVAEASAVVHLAAQTAVTTSLDDPIADFEVNARGTLNVLEAVRHHNSEAPVLFASTNKVYGRLLHDEQVRRSGERYEPVDAQLSNGVAEDAPLDLYSPYGCSKGAADQYVHDYARVFGLKAVVLRMSCIYGTRQFGTEDQGWVAHFLLKVLRGEPITLYGNGCQVRDVLYIDDAVRAWAGALDNIEQTAGKVFNLGGGPARAVSLLEMLHYIGELTGKEPEVGFSEWRPGDQPWYVSDTRSLSSTLGWEPRVSTRDGLERLKAWLEEGVLKRVS